MQKTIVKNSTSQLPRITNSFKTPYRKRYEPELCEAQKIGYEKIIKGLRAYTQEELSKMSECDKRSVTYLQNKAWNLINTMKQSKMNNLLNHILGSVFGSTLCGNAVDILTKPVSDANFILRDMDEIKISRMEIITAFISKGFLPKNFLA